MIRNVIHKIVVGTGIGRLSQQAQFEEKMLPEIMRELGEITGQKPATRKAKKAISNFKTRVGNVIGLQVTLRGKRMESFLEKIIHVVLPRVKDFRGIDMHNVDKGGNLNIGFKEQQVFPEVDTENSRIPFGIQVTIVPKEQKREKTIEFYKSIKVPFKKDDQKAKNR